MYSAVSFSKTCFCLVRHIHGVSGCVAVCIVLAGYGHLIASCFSHCTFNINGIFMTACSVNAFSHSYVRTTVFSFHAGFLSCSFLSKVIHSFNRIVNVTFTGVTDVAHGNVAIAIHCRVAA